VQKAILDLGRNRNEDTGESDSPIIERYRYGCVGSDRDRKTAALGFQLSKIDASNKSDIDFLNA
jgi:hypothetical protein